MTDERNRLSRSSVTRAIRVIGDRWSLLIIRDAFQGVRRFQEFLERTGTSRATLTNRLRALVKNGLMKRVKYSNAPPRFEYRLTEKGRDLYSLALVAWNWERRWAPRGSGVPLKLVHVPCDHLLQPELVCGDCDLMLSIFDSRMRPGPGANARPLAAASHYRRLSALTAANHRGSHAALTHIADIVGDAWTPLVLAAGFFGLHRFDDIQQELGIATNILSSRLNLLVSQGIFERRLYSQQPKRYEYRFTDKGRELYQYAVLLNAWGEKWLTTAVGPSYYIVHRPCGKDLIPKLRCGHCHAELVPGSVLAAPDGRKAKRARKAAAAA